MSFSEAFKSLGNVFKMLLVIPFEVFVSRKISSFPQGWASVKVEYQLARMLLIWISWNLYQRENFTLFAVLPPIGGQNSGNQLESANFEEKLQETNIFWWICLVCRVYYQVLTLSDQVSITNGHNWPFDTSITSISKKKPENQRYFRVLYDLIGFMRKYKILTPNQLEVGEIRFFHPQNSDLSLNS